VATGDIETKADAVLVLGCALLPDGAPSPALRRRVAAGIAAYEAGRARLLLLAGGGAPPEAAAMAALARAAGVPEEALLLEPRSRDTAENAAFAAALLRQRGLGRVLLVSDRFHLPRARLLCRRAGLAVVATAHPAPRLARDWPMMLREAAAWLLLGWRLVVRPAGRAP
jgi:uncharacterized SAM-binding protein YcdF (DUF218 family)